MAGNILNWTLNASIPGGPSLSVSSPLAVEGYDMIAVEIAAKAKDQEVRVLPGVSTDVNFLLIKAEPFTDSAKPALGSITYKVTDGKNKSGDIELNAPMHLLLGTGNVNILGIAPNSLLFTNKLKDEKGQDRSAQVQVLAARNVKVAPQPGP